MTGSKTHLPYVSDGLPAKDEFQRESFAKRVADTILAQPLGESLVVSIVGAWGSGKSTVLEYIRKEVSGRTASEGTCYIAQFNPWRFAGEDALLFELMDALVKAIDPNNQLLTVWQKIRNSVAARKEAFSQMATSAAGDFLGGAGASLLAGDLRVQMEEVRDAAANHLNRARKRVVVLLDDVDRLEADELLLLLKTIKLITDLPNTTYVIAMDEEHVSQARLVECISTPNREELTLSIVDSPTELDWAFHFRNNLSDDVLKVMTDPAAITPNPVDLKLACRSIDEYKSDKLPTQFDQISDRVWSISRNIKHGTLKSDISVILENSPAVIMHLLCAGCGYGPEFKDACWTWDDKESLRKICDLVAPSVLQESLNKQLVIKETPKKRQRAGWYYYTLEEIGWLCLAQLEHVNIDDHRS